MASCAAALFHKFVWEPYSRFAEGLSSATAVQSLSNTDAGATAGVSLDPRAYVQRLNRTIRSRLVPRERFKGDHHDTCMFIERSKNENLVVYQANLIDSKTGESVRSGANQPHCSFKPGDPLHVYWIKINPEHVARRRARGELEDTCELNMIERNLAYGCKAAVISKDKFVNEVLPDKASRTAASKEKIEAIGLVYDELQPCVCRFVAASSWLVWMLRLSPLIEAEDVTAGVAFSTEGEALPPRRGSEEHALPTRDTVVVMVAMIDEQLSILQKVYVESVEPKHFYQLPRVKYVEVHGTSLETGKPTYERRPG